MKDPFLFLRRAMVAITFTGTMIAILVYCSGESSPVAESKLTRPLARESVKAPSRTPSKSRSVAEGRGNPYSLTTASPCIITD